MRQRTVEDVMTRAVVTAYQQALFKDIASLMIKRGISAMPVIDEDRRVVGVVSEADLMAKQEHLEVEKPPLFAGRRDRLSRAKARGLSARSLMSSPAITVRPETTVTEAAKLLDRHKIKRLPVVDGNGDLVGIVSRRDLLRVFARPDEEIRDEVLNEVLVKLLWADPKEISVEVEHGVVTLGGRLDPPALIPIAVRITTALDGVVDVMNRLGGSADETTGHRRMSHA
jgi:CBS-domain-containing membrane protein